MSSTKDELLFTTDKDEFLYYVPTETGKILLLTDPLFADRVRSGQDEEIRYGRMPAKLFCNNRTVEGTLFYQRWAWIDPPQQKRKGPFAGLEPGGRLFAVWGPGGEFLYVEKGGSGQGGKAQFAVMQDRRGRWQETYQIRWTEPECAFSPSPCPGESREFRLSIPAWDVEGSLEKLEQVLVPTGVTDEEGVTSGGAPSEGVPSEDAAIGRRFPSSGRLLDFPACHSPGEGEGRQFGRVLSSEGKHLGRAESEGGLRHRVGREGTVKRVAPET